MSTIFYMVFSITLNYSEQRMTKTFTKDFKASTIIL